MTLKDFLMCLDFEKVPPETPILIRLDADTVNEEVYDPIIGFEMRGSNYRIFLECADR